MIRLHIRDKKYDNISILKDCKIEVKENQFITIMGKSGIGKSTILRILMGLDNDFDGELIVNHDFTKGVVFQEDRLIPWLTLKKNIEFALSKEINHDERKIKINNALNLVKLTNHQNKWIKDLSGGMKKRVSIARAIVDSPTLLILDEPFVALDYQTKRVLQEDLQEIIRKQNLTCVMVSHSFEEAIFFSDSILIIDNQPATIVHEIKINQKNMKGRSSPIFQSYVQRLNNIFFSHDC